MVRVVINLVMDLPDGVLRVHTPERFFIHVLHIGRHVYPYVNLMAVKSTVRCELQHGFLEVEIPSVAQGGGYTLPLLVQRGGGELHAFFDFAAVVGGYLIYRGIGDIHLVVPDHVGLVGGDEVAQIDFAFLDNLMGVYFGVEIAHVVHLQSQLLHAYSCQFVVVDNRRFAHLVGIAGESLVGLGGGVYGRSVVDMQLKLPESQYLGVLPLAEIGAQLVGRHFFVVNAFDTSFVEQTLVLWYELGRVARAENKE